MTTDDGDGGSSVLGLTVRLVGILPVSLYSLARALLEGRAAAYCTLLYS